jgi:hypothetical protein
MKQLLMYFLTKRCRPDEPRQVKDRIASEETNKECPSGAERIGSLKNELHFSDKYGTEPAYDRFLSLRKNRPAERSLQQPQKQVNRRLLTKYLKYAVAIFTLSVLSYAEAKPAGKTLPLETEVFESAQKKVTQALKAGRSRTMLRLHNEAIDKFNDGEIFEGEVMELVADAGREFYKSMDDPDFNTKYYKLYDVAIAAGAVYALEHIETEKPEEVREFLKYFKNHYNIEETTDMVELAKKIHKKASGIVTQAGFKDLFDVINNGFGKLYKETYNKYN